MSSPAIETKNLRLRRGSFHMDAGSLALKPGTITAIIGMNGSGKSTLLRSLAGIDRPASGSVMAAGRPMSLLSTIERALTIGWCPNDVQTPFAYNCREIVVMGRYPVHQGYPRRQDREIAAAYLQDLDLVSFAERRITELSSGEKQRVMLARCLAGETPIVLLDEPSANLDLAHALMIFKKLTALKGQGKTIVVALHDLNLANQFADFVILLSRGRVHSHGLTHQVLSKENLSHAMQVDVERVELKQGGTYLVTNYVR